MKLSLDGGLNLNDPIMIGERETSISENVDYRQKGVARSRDGRTSLYSNAGGYLIGSAAGYIYSYGTSIFENGVDLGTGITGPVATGRMHLYNSTQEVQFLASSSNYKMEAGTVYQWGIVAPTSAPTCAAGGGTGLTGDYQFKYTYVRKSGGSLIHESNPSDTSATFTASDDDITVTFSSTSDSQVTHVRVYRTLAGQTADFYYDGEAAIGDGTYTTSVSDSALGALIETDNDTPPSSIQGIAGPGAYNRLFVISGNKVYYSKGNRPESFPSTYYSEFGTTYFPGKAVVDWGGLIYIFTQEGVYYLQGSTPTTFFPIRTMASEGLFSKHGIATTERGIYYHGSDGLYVFTGQSEQKITSSKVDPIFRGDTVSDVNPINQDNLDNCWLEYFNNKIFFGYPDSGNTYPNKVLVLDLDEGKYSIYDYGITIRSVYRDKLNKRLLAGDSDGNIWRLEYGDGDGGSSFTFKVRSRELTQLEHISPIFARYDIYNAGGNTIYARLIEEGTTIAERSFTDSDAHKRRFFPPISTKSTQLEIESDVTSRVSVGLIEIE